MVVKARRGIGGFCLCIPGGISAGPGFTAFFQDQPDAGKNKFDEPSRIGAVAGQFRSVLVLCDDKKTVGAPYKKSLEIIGKKLDAGDYRPGVCPGTGSPAVTVQGALPFYRGLLPTG
jgi:hypothetical protein